MRPERMFVNCNGKVFMNRLFTFGFAAVTAAAMILASACNTDGVIYDEREPLPVIALDSEDGIYTVKVGRTVTITPSVENDDGASYAWIIDGETVGTRPSHTFTFDSQQSVYVSFRVTTAAGTAEADLRIDVVDLAPPVISLAIADGTLQLPAGAEYTFRPVIRNSNGEDFSCEWLLDGRSVSSERFYTFSESGLGSYTLTIRAENEDGTDSRDIAIEVVDKLSQSVRFAGQSYLHKETDRYTVAGRPVYLTPQLENFAEPHFAWSVDGAVQEGASGRTFIFRPDSEGSYRISVDVSDSGGSPVHAEVVVHCAAAAASRAKTASSSRYQNRVFEYIPAPGQFINETLTGGFDDTVTTHEAALAYASQRMEEKKFVSLGGFGGYIIVGFDHSIVNRGGSGYDFSIQGNAFLSNVGGSNEPGIVWVMQDTNGNGLPDDEWYELRGSETDSDGTIRGYEVTYYRPERPQMPVQWSDSQGNTGTIDYVKAFHRQDYYYPLWVAAVSYTLRGTRLTPKNTYDEATGFWHNNPFEWGYADNFGSDSLSAGDAASDGEGQSNGFKIANAIHADGSPAGLTFIDFIKVQTALNTKSGGLGENSTEVFSFDDLSM